ncbi:unnamed protein product [Rotaria sp. Silwood1]|nr:unnamed protein product [Rotaria sp. Silwood1]CAF3641739.1 unnamed protein product [Rotaria sp. Silwood1]CAF4797961.1 unnamed protein product [Rotaria sp. Silwood1]CAF4865049.1 unnamed protein product [Rotaria sp. Silwood1]
MVYIKLKYFTLRGPIPGLSPHIFFGNLLQSGLLLGKRSASDVYISFKKRFGDIYQYWLGFMRFIVVHDIDDVQYVLTHRNIYDQGQVSLIGLVITSIYSFWLLGFKFKRHGTLTMPLFRRSKIISNINTIVDSTDKLLDRWRARPHNQVHTDVVEQCQNLLLEIFGLIAFDYNLETLDNKYSSNNNELTEALLDIMSTFKMAIYAPSFVSIIYMKLNTRFQRARATVERHFHKMIEQELAESPESRAQRKKTSLIASLVNSLQADEKVEARKKEEDKRGLSRKEVFDEVLMFLIAGYETTSTALAWSIYHLSKQQRVQQKIKAELMENNGGQHLSLDYLDSLIYLDCFINEVLRYSPTIDSTCRSVTVDDCLPKSGTRLYKGDQVLIPTSSLARDRRHWKIDPELFYPERFLDEDKNHHPYAFLAFGGGHRQCLGQDLALFELKVILARMLQQMTIGDGGPEVNAGGFIQKLTLIPKHVGVTIEFH